MSSITEARGGPQAGITSSAQVANSDAAQSQGEAYELWWCCDDDHDDYLPFAVMVHGNVKIWQLKKLIHQEGDRGIFRDVNAQTLVLWTLKEAFHIKPAGTLRDWYHDLPTDFPDFANQLDDPSQKLSDIYPACAPEGSLHIIVRLPQVASDKDEDEGDEAGDDNDDEGDEARDDNDDEGDEARDGNDDEGDQFTEVSEWEKKPPPNVSPYSETYYRLFPALHPRHPLDVDDHVNPTVSGVVSSMDGSVIRLIPNLKVSIDDLEIMDLAEDAQTVPIKLLLRTSWRPRLDEVRIMINKKPTYDSLQNLNEADYQEKVLKVVPKSSSTYRKPSSQRYGAKSTPTQPHFVGPQLSLRSTFEKPGSLNFKENVLGNSFRCYDGDYRSLQTKPADPPPTSESGDLGGMWIHTECVVDEQNLLCDGGLRGFPFERRIATLHVSSVVGLRDIAFYEPNTADPKKLLEKLKEPGRIQKWSVMDVQLIPGFRDLGGVQSTTVKVNRSNIKELDSIRSQLTLKITIGRDRSYWFMKVIFPLDVITIAGFTVLLVIPSLPSPSPDQQLSALTILAAIVVALAAFTMSAQSMLPKLNYMTVFDIHSNVCFAMIAILMLVIAAFPSADLAWFGAMRDQRRSIVFGILLAILVLEHALLYAFMQWWWTMPNTRPQLVRSRSRSPTRSRYG